MNMLKKLDNYFYTHTKKDLIYAILGSAVLLGFVFFYFIYPNVKHFEKIKETEYNNLSQKLNQMQVKLMVLKVRKMKLSNNLKIARTELIDLKKQESFYVELTDLLDYTKFNRQKWADYVKNLIADAKKEGMKVKLIENKIYDEDVNNTKFKNLPKSLIVKKMSIGIKLNGNYKNFIYYIYKYEDLKDLLRIGTIKIDSENNYYVKFFLYGYKK